MFSPGGAKSAAPEAKGEEARLAAGGERLLEQRQAQLVASAPVVPRAGPLVSLHSLYTLLLN